MSAILEVQQLVKKYGDKVAVNGISFDIQAGEIFSLLGPNGAGKTTTISVLSTLYVPTAGDAVIGGHSVVKEPMAVRNLIGVVPQDLALYEDLTACENLAFWGQMYNLSGKALNARIDQVLEQIGLKDRAKQRVKTFSGGMKRRVNIGVGLLHQPRLLFMDEPTRSLDPGAARSLRDFIKEHIVAERGKTVFISTHQLDEAEQLCDTIAILDDGRIRAQGSPDELKSGLEANSTLCDVFSFYTGKSFDEDGVSHVPFAIPRRKKRGYGLGMKRKGY